MVDEIKPGEGQVPPQDPSKAPEQKPVEKDPEILSKEQQLANLDKAIAEANADLKKKREERRELETLPKTEEPARDPQPQGDLEIDMNDPSSKAWDKHIKNKVDPVQKELEAEREEMFKFTFRKFAQDYPSLASDHERAKRVIATYHRIKDNTGRTEVGILNDLERAYAAENSELLLQGKTEKRVNQARKDAIFSDPAVSRGAGNYIQERESDPQYSQEDAAILAKWGMTPQSHAQLTREINDKRNQE